VRDAVVTVHEGARGEGAPRLVAYVAPAARERSKESEIALVAAWETTYAENGYEPPATSGQQADSTPELTLDLRGWKSSYTGEDIPAAEMRVWAESTVARILEAAPRNVLEIGCGTGMLLSRVAPRVERYRATDFSRFAVEHVSLLKTKLGLENVTVTQQPAHDLTGLTGEVFDTVIINSVVQYFPSADYLVDVIEGLLGLMGPTGTMFLGDIRHLALLETYHAAVEHHRAGAAISRRELQGRVQRALINENELVLHPHFFDALRARFPQIVGVEIAPKRGAFKNELTLFRYDVTLQIGAAPASQAPIAWRDIESEGLTLAWLRGWIAQSAPGSTLGLRGISNARLHEENELRRWVAGDDDHDLQPWQPPPADPRAWEPESLFALPAELPCQVRVSWAAGRADGSVDAIVTTGGLPAPPSPLDPPVAPQRWGDLANDPLQGRAHKELAATLRHELREALPSHLLPSAIVVLPVLPLNINGKVDLRALPPVTSVDTSAQESEPRSDDEQKLAEVWCKLLGLDRVGIHDSFFEVGGDSLLAVQVVSRLPLIFGVELPVRALLESPTIHGLAQHLEVMRAAGRSAAPLHPLHARPHAGTLPVSLPQRRLWFLSQLEGANVAYNMPFVTQLSGSLDIGALSRSIDEIVRRHESLRTTFRLETEGPVQVIHPPAPVELHLDDLSGLDPVARRTELDQRIDHEVHWAFDIEQGPLLRARLFRVSAAHHVLSLVIHHIIGDGWSMGVFLRELAALYEAFTASRPSPLPTPTLQYADFSRWQEERLAGSVGEQQLAYWRKKLAHLEPLQLPTDRPRPAVEAFRGDHHVFRVDRELTRALKGLSGEEGVTLYVTLLAVFNVLLARIAGQDDIAVASTTANRKHPALEGLIGFFVNTVVVRSDLSDNPTFRALLSKVREAVMEATEHEDLPLERIVEDLRPERTAGQSPLAQVMLTMHKESMAALALPGIEVTPWDRLRFRKAKLDLTLLIAEADDGLELTFEYNSDLFDRRTVERMSAHYQNLLRDVVRDRDLRIGELSLLDDHERRQILVEWNRTEAPFSSEACIHELFEAQVDRTPDAVAVVDLCGQPAGSRGVPITYRELDQRANQVAHRLRSLGVGPDTLVGLCLERSTDLIVGLLGILKAGGAYAVLDPEHPHKRLAFLLEDTSVPVVLTLGSLLARLPEIKAQVVDVEKGFKGEPVHRPESGVRPNNLAYVLYTSGSTGDPNGAMVEHRGLCNVVEVTLPVMDIGSDARLAHATAFNFDGATGPLFWMLVVGGTIYLAPRDTDSLGKGLIELIDREAITHIFLVPSMLAALPDAELPSLRAISLGGEPVSAELVTRWGHGGRIRNMYGPTEVTIFATAVRCFPDGSAPTIGRPIGNLQAYILDPWGQPVPAGVVGELYLGGAGVGRGYLHRPELTARKFIENPFCEGRLYRTGDMVRYGMTGEGPPEIEFLGRMDGQIKFRGQRIELGEVQSALRAHESVRDAVATVQGGADGGAPARIVAYVTLVNPESSKEQDLIVELRRMLGEALPPYMVPSAIVVLPAFPLNINGKVDLRALPPPEASLDTTEHAEPQTDTEHKLAEVWCKVLGLSRIGIHHNFFELGGHSLLVMQVISRLPSIVGAHLSARALLEKPTIHELARHIDTLHAAQQLAKERSPAGASRRQSGRI
jgi:amino acid adenylation domain-containing protein